ncbi:putative baseplate assembly protein [Paraburkholderia sp. JPY432]|uniref:putative baseplate assembly protein n=1 Tax=Paraburkholderia youngii TaxID=2782701 RepID=UPI0015957656|nr:putative baseplate assembly protein [Paraburkholderia youngii]NVH74230.1 putative baseplate assembly protein [Paraburkholderia youngii]
MSAGLPACASQASAVCAVDARRDAVRAQGQLGGIDYVEVYPDRTTLSVHFFGRVPEALTVRNVVIDGGERVTGIRVLAVELVTHDDGDACLLVSVDREGDFSSYCVCLVDEEVSAASGVPAAPLAPRVPAGIDPRYACSEFRFRAGNPGDTDCQPTPCPPAVRGTGPVIDYLARDFTSFRRLLLDRLALTMPEWTERHAPDIGITLVELLAYVADQLSYKLDAVATESWLGSARLRISVRRHARLVDYRMHEGCNARAWVTIAANADLTLATRDLVFAAPPEGAVWPAGLIGWDELQAISGAVLFQAIDLSGTGALPVRAAHSAIRFYCWRGESCCLPQGSVRATLLDALQPDGASRTLALAAGDMLVLEETAGAATGSAADADPDKRHVVRLTRVEPAVDPLDGTPLLEIEWARADALPFALCIAARTAAADCRLVECALARANVVLVDHGLTVHEIKDAWLAASASVTGHCECGGTVHDVKRAPLPLAITLGRTGITYADALPAVTAAFAAGDAMRRDPRAALPQAALDALAVDPLDPQAAKWPGTYAWSPVFDLLSSKAGDTHFVVEIDDAGSAQLRFGDGVRGQMPAAGTAFRARYRIGNGPAGNVGRDAITWIATRGTALTGASLTPRNPLAAVGGVAPEPVADVKRYAPHAYGRVLERAVAAADYASIAEQDSRIQGAFASLAWTGVNYEACLALDPYAAAADDPTLVPATRARLEAARRIGHDVRIVPVRRVPVLIGLRVHVAPGYLRGDVEAAVLDLLSSGVRSTGALGWFHPDNLRFGVALPASPIIAAVQALDGVAHIALSAFARERASAADASASLDAGVIDIAADEIVQLDNDPNFPEHGTLRIDMRGGR